MNSSHSWNVLHLIESAAAGAGQHVLNLTQGMLQRGHRVHIVYSATRIDRLFANGLKQLAEMTGFSSFELPMYRNPHWTDLRAVLGLREYKRRNGPFDIVHCHSTKAGFIGRLPIASDSTRSLYTPHAFRTMDPVCGVLLKRAVQKLERILARRCDGIIVVSREEYAHALQLGIPASKLCCIPNGVPGDTQKSVHLRVTLRRDWGVSDNEVCIGFVGRLVPMKSPHTMLRAFATFSRDRRTNARLVVVGDGPLAPELRSLAANLGIQAQVLWLGEQDAKPLMAGLDLLALTSDVEGHPLVVLEAMTRGLPIIATAVGGVADTVQDGVNGFVTPIRGIHEIATAIDVLVNSAPLRERMGAASREISRNFSVDRMVDRTLTFYDQIVSGTSSPLSSPDLTVPALR